MVLIIILVGFAGFGLGRLSIIGEKSQIIIEQSSSSFEKSTISTSEPKNLAGGANSNIGGIVASKNGTKYYLPGCSGVGRILDQNKIYFNSEKEALDAGYTRAAGCK